MNLKELLRPHFSEEVLGRVVRGYDIIGDVAIIKIPPECEEHEALIAEAVMKACPRVRVVGKRAGIHGGEYRLLPLAKIGGDGSFRTIHKEFGVRLHLDPSQVYFSPRSAEERFRLASRVGRGERVLVMFSGIAPLPLMIGRHAPVAEIIGIEKNPVAHDFASCNLKTNRQEDIVRLICGDVMESGSLLQGTFDRVVMPLPAGGAGFLDTALELLREFGWLHFYAFQHRNEFDVAKETVAEACRRAGRKLVRATVQSCGHVAPQTYRVCVDAQVGDAGYGYC